MKASDSIAIIDDTLKDFNMNFDNSGYKFLSLVYGRQDDLAIIHN